MASRRTLLAAGAAGAGLVAAGAGLQETALRLAGNATAAPRRLAPEARVDPATGAVTPNPAQFMAHVACPGCAASCGARLRVDRTTGRVLRVTGNPYHPLSADPPLPAPVPLREAIAALSRRGESGLAQRAVLCARGAPAADQSGRLRKALKRVGPRGAGQWQEIALEQVVREVIEGGNLFGEGKLDGLRTLRNDAAAGPVAVLCGWQTGRSGFARAFLRAYGGGGVAVQRVVPPLPDLRAANVVLVFGGALPGAVPGRQIAERRAAGVMQTVLADAVLGPADNRAVGARSRWLPIRPGSEAVLARALIRRISGQDGPDDAAASCGVADADIAALARAFAAQGRQAACVATRPVSADAALAMQALNALAGHAGRSLSAPGLNDGVKALFLWGCDAAPAITAPLVVAVTAVPGAAMQEADYVVPDALAFESWGCAAGPGDGVTTSWPAVSPPVSVGMERLLTGCARALEMPGFGAEAAAVWHIRAIAELAAASPSVPEISDDDLVLAGLDRVRPVLEAVLGEAGWRRAAFVLARGGRFDATAAARIDAPLVLAASPLPIPLNAAADWPLILAVRAPLLPGQTCVALHEADATALHLRDGDAVTVETPAGAHTGRLLVRKGVMRGVVAVSADLQDGLPARVTLKSWGAGPHGR